MTEPVTLTDLQEQGYVQEANRLFFHPLGLELYVNTTTKNQTLEVLDYRDDETGVFYPEAQLNTPEAEQIAMRVANELGERTEARTKICGGRIQSIPTTLRIPRVVDAPGIDGQRTELRSITAQGVDTPSDPENWTPDVWFRIAEDGTQERLITGWTRNPEPEVDPPVIITPTNPEIDRG